MDVVIDKNHFGADGADGAKLNSPFIKLEGSEPSSQQEENKEHLYPSLPDPNVTVNNRAENYGAISFDHSYLTVS